MNYTFPRSAWVDPAMPIKGPAFDWSTIEWVVIHYTADNDLPDGDPKPGESQDFVKPYLRSVHRDYTVNRGYSIGYSSAVDQWGASYELRGDTFKAASNANPGVPGDENAKTFSILCLVDGADPATLAAVTRIQDLVAQVRAKRPGVTVVGHRDVDQTTCPGAGLYAQVKSGVFAGGSTAIPMVMKYGGTPTAGWGGWYSLDGGKKRLPIYDMAGARHLTITLEAIDAVTKRRPSDPVNWTDVSHTTSEAELNKYLCSTCLAPTPPPTGGHVLLYKVREGDSYWKVAETVYADGKATTARVSAIQNANGGKALHPGDIINIPGRVA